MGILGKSEKELKAYAQELEKKSAELDKRESDVERGEGQLHHEQELLSSEKDAFDTERKNHTENVRKIHEQMEADKADLEKRRQEVIRLEAEAKVGFAKAQNDVFKDVIEKRIRELDARQANLDARSNDIADRLKALNIREGDIARRELAVTEREQIADAGFADKAASLAAEAKRQHEANLAEAKSLEDREKQLSDAKQEFEKEKEALRQRAQGVAEAEQKRDAGFVDEKAELDRELNEKRVKWQEVSAQEQSDFRKEMADLKTQRLADLDAEIAEIRKARLDEISADGEKLHANFAETMQKEMTRTHEEIKRERDEWADERSRQMEELKAQRNANEMKAGELSAKEDYLNGRAVELENSERHLEKLRASFDDIVLERVDEYKKSKESEINDLKELVENLRNSVHEQTGLLGVFEDLKRRLNDKEPAQVLLEMDAKTAELKRLQEDLVNRPPKELQERFKALEKERDREKSRADELQNSLEANEKDAADARELRRRNNELESENSGLKQERDTWKASSDSYNAQLQRLLSAFERPAEIAARYKEIEMPYITADTFKPPVKSGKLNELDWLNGIHEACRDYGLRFPMRILKAFHTALKTAEWSPLTVLAGVSGTGKSELPRLYSHFGGLLFMPLSVQPNWDSQESMLGFFNAIDNKFDAQPVLRFLAQSQQMPNESYDKRIKRWQEMVQEAKKTLVLDSEKDKELIESLQESNYPGLKRCVCMVLLDEMNLAHPELYFAEFLSKLELRRGMNKDEVPYLPVKIGAGLPPYQLPLGRNVLWAGTMNQDETTKSLSDKVLDRSITIYFPRPTALERRPELKSLDEKNRGKLLHKMDFNSWIAQFDEDGKKTFFSDEQIKPYKEFIEKINNALGIAGRAIGHRVWQSVEYYMANYPDVRAILKDGGDESELREKMHVAFEDQLVQKVMPKLRGIDTRGSSSKCLDDILDQLNKGIDGKPFKLENDFLLARNLGHGQFIWQSANYLNEESEEKEPAGDDSDAGAEEPPETDAGVSEKTKGANSRKKS